MADILVIDDDPGFSEVLVERFFRQGHRVATAATLDQGLMTAQTDGQEIIFLDVHLPDGSGLESLPRFNSLPQRPTVIIITGMGDADGAELAIGAGAWDYITKPVKRQQLSLVLSRVIQFREQLKSAGSSSDVKRDSIVGSSNALARSLDLMVQAAASESSVLISGETGTGKELFARAVHENSPRAQGGFVVVDCATLPENLVPSVLFGHVKGAFTGADRDSEGLIRQAHGGTLFLDEIGELPLVVQKAFLRALAEHRFLPVGGRDPVTSDFRVVAATNRDLPAMVEDGQFREDLLFRLKSFSIALPPLRERAGDIMELVDFYLARLDDLKGIGPKDTAPDFLAALEAYDWPGNVRELFSAIDWAVAVARGEPKLYPHHLPQNIRAAIARAAVAKGGSPPSPGPQPSVAAGPLPILKDYKDQMERKYLVDLMAVTDGNVKDGCRISGLSQSRLYAILKKHGLKRSGWGED